MFSKSLTRFSNRQELHRVSLPDSPVQETGRQFESSFVGTCHVSWKGEYVPYVASLEMVRRNQPGDAVHARGEILLKRVAEALEVNVSELTLLTALGTPMDQFHGTDALIEFKGIVAALDFKKICLNDSRKAIIIHPRDVDSGFYLVAQRIAAFFRTSARIKGINLA